MGDSEGRKNNLFWQFMEWNRRLQYIEDMILKLIVELITKKERLSYPSQEVGWVTPEEIEWYHLKDLKLDEWEMEYMRMVVSALAKRFAARCSYKFKRAKRGTIDLGRTIKTACTETLGVPFRLKYKKRVFSKPELAVLCDVSPSVEMFSQFLLELVCALQQSFRTVRTFLFIDTVDEVTGYLRDYPPTEAVKIALERGKYSIRPFSDYGKALGDFERLYLPTLSPKTTLIILGDARNNYYPERGDSLGRIRDHVKEVVWINPQPREEWDKEDNIMSVFAKHCSLVFECRNLRQLAKVVEDLV